MHNELKEIQMAKEKGWKRRFKAAQTKVFDKVLGQNRKRDELQTIAAALELDFDERATNAELREAIKEYLDDYEHKLRFDQFSDFDLHVSMRFGSHIVQIRARLSLWGW